MLLSFIFQNSILCKATNSVGSPPSCGEGLGAGGRELWLQTRPYSHRAKHLGRHDHLGLVPPLIQLEKKSGEFRREQKVLSRISGLSGRDHTLEEQFLATSKRVAKGHARQIRHEFL